MKKKILLILCITLVFIAGLLIGTFVLSKNSNHAKTSHSCPCILLYVYRYVQLWYFAIGSYRGTNFGTHGVSCGISSSTHTNSRNSAEFLCRFIYNLNRSYFAKVAIVYKNASAFALA